MGRWLFRAAAVPGLWLAATAALAAEPPGPVVVELEGTVQVAHGPVLNWTPAHTNQTLLPGDHLRTLAHSRATLRLSDRSLMRLDDYTHLQMPPAAPRRSGFHLFRGLLELFHRDRRGEFPVHSGTAFALTLGTEFTVSVDANDTMRLDLIDGEAMVTNNWGAVSITSGEAAVAAPGRIPFKVPRLEAVNVIQWVLYLSGHPGSG